MTARRLIESEAVGSPTTESKFAILQRPAIRDTIVPACVAGVSVVKLDVQDDADEFASPGDDPTSMTTGSGGAARILWKESGTGKRWGIVSFPVGGSGGKKTIRGVIVEAVSKPDDITADIPTGMGKIKLPGQNERFDCGCKLLAESEQLLNEEVEAEEVAVDNPDYDPNAAESDDNAKKKKYYLAVNIKDHYDGVRLQSDLTYNGTSTVKVLKGDEELEFTVYDGALTSGKTYKADTPVYVHREGFKLWVTDGPCQDEEGTS